MLAKECEERLENRQIRLTSARILILHKLSEIEYPVSLLELETMLETLDKSTISRSLAVLLEHHIIHSFEDGSGSTKYEICRSTSGECAGEDRHMHFYCVECRRTFCLKGIEVPIIQLPEGYTPLSINYTAKGICPKCMCKKKQDTV